MSSPEMRCKCWQCMKHDREAVDAFAAGPPAMKAMKAAKKKVSARLATAMKKLVGGRLAKRHVFAGKTAKTSSGLYKGDLVANKRGKIVSAKASAKGKKSPWITAVAAARKALNIQGFAAIKKGSPLYKKAKALHKK